MAVFHIDQGTMWIQHKVISTLCAGLYTTGLVWRPHFSSTRQTLFHQVLLRLRYTYNCRSDFNHKCPRISYLSWFSSISCLSCFEVLHKHKTYINVNFLGWEFPSSPSNGYHQILLGRICFILHRFSLKRESFSSRHFLFCSDSLVLARDSLVSARDSLVSTWNSLVSDW